MSKLSSDEVVSLSKKHTFFSWSAQTAVNPIPVDHAKGVYFWDMDGKRYIDFNSQLMCVNIGHGDQRVTQAITKQAEKLAYIAPNMTTELRARVGQRLAQLTPGDLNKFFFTLGGAEANENAIKLARAYTGRHKIIVRHRAYHGATHGAMMLTGDPRRWGSEPGMSGVVRIFDPHPYNPALRDGALGSLDYIEEVLAYEGPYNVAAIIIEPVTGTNGLLIPPDGYLTGLRDLCDKYGILLICDEVMSGFGRTGEWFAVNHWDVVPDIMCIAKGLTSGYLPLGAVAVNDKVAAHFDENVFWGGLTYNAHALSLAAANAVLDIYEADKLIENAREMGKLMARHHADLRENHPSVGDTRSIGLFGLIELVKNQATQETLTSYNGSSPVMNRFAAALVEKGLFTFTRWFSFFTNPPLSITAAELQEGFAIIDEALQITDDALEG
jgi:taurine--2-oxoglutarate transaminase